MNDSGALGKKRGHRRPHEPQKRNRPTPRTVESMDRGSRKPGQVPKLIPAGDKRDVRIAQSRALIGKQFAEIARRATRQLLCDVKDFHGCAKTDPAGSGKPGASGI